MPRVIITDGATQGLERCRRLLAEKNPHASRRAGQVIQKYFKVLETEPEFGRPFEDIPQWRELIIPFGDSGYATLYFFDSSVDAVYILAFRHQKEAGYGDK